MFLYLQCNRSIFKRLSLFCHKTLIAFFIVLNVKPKKELNSYKKVKLKLKLVGKFSIIHLALLESFEANISKNLHFFAQYKERVDFNNNNLHRQ